MKAAVGQTVVLRCRVFGAPKPVVTWKKGTPGVVVAKSEGGRNGGNKYKIMEDGDLEITVRTL